MHENTRKSSWFLSVLHRPLVLALNDCKQEMRWMVDMLPRLYIELGIILRAVVLKVTGETYRDMTEEQKTIATTIIPSKGMVYGYLEYLNKKLAKEIDTRQVARVVNILAVGIIIIKKRVCH